MQRKNWNDKNWLQIVISVFNIFLHTDNKRLPCSSLNKQSMSFMLKLTDSKSETWQLKLVYSLF